MAERFKAHAQHIRDLLYDVQEIVERQYPLADPDYDGYLAEQITFMLKPMEFTPGDDPVVVDVSLVWLITDVQSLLDSMVPGPDQSEWVKELMASDKSTTKKTGTGNRTKS